MSDAAAILASSTLLIDEYLPRFDTTRREHLVVRGEPSAVLEEVRNLDLLSLHSPLLDTVMWVRTLPEKMGRKEPADVPSMRLGDLFDEAAEPTADQPWVGLGERKGRELVIGVVGKFWQPSISWNTVPADRFVSFDEPGWGKIAASISVVPYGTGRTLVTYEARTRTTDQRSRRRFGIYWRVVSPFVGVVMRSLLTAVSRRMEELERSSSS
ncbi:MAG: hypothetical protein WBM50_22295 [Acidimicrobiales bacterium]